MTNREKQSISIQKAIGWRPKPSDDIATKTRRDSMANTKVFIIAEVGVKHNGRDDRAIRSVKVGAAGGADVVKCHTFCPDKLTRKGAERAEYQKRATGDQHANEITILPVLAHVASENLTLFVSIGMASMKEVKTAVAAIAEERSRHGFTEPKGGVVTVLHSSSNCPTTPADLNLLAMSLHSRETRQSVGSCDHTLGLAVSTGAVALGARAIEKHINLVKTLPGTDHGTPLAPTEFTALVEQNRAINLAFGEDIKAPTASKIPVRALARRSSTAADFSGPVSRVTARCVRPGEPRMWAFVA